MKSWDEIDFNELMKVKLPRSIVNLIISGIIIFILLVALLYVDKLLNKNIRPAKDIKQSYQIIIKDKDKKIQSLEKELTTTKNILSSQKLEFKKSPVLYDKNIEIVNNNLVNKKSYDFDPSKSYTSSSDETYFYIMIYLLLIIGVCFSYYSLCIERNIDNS